MTDKYTFEYNNETFDLNDLFDTTGNTPNTNFPEFKYNGTTPYIKGRAAESSLFASPEPDGEETNGGDSGGNSQAYGKSEIYDEGIDTCSLPSNFYSSTNNNYLCAKNISYTSTTSNVVIPGWCDYLIVVLVGGGGGGRWNALE